MALTELRTERLWLRRWRDSDRAPFAMMNADPAVMEYYPALLTGESDALVDRIEESFERRGFGLWAVELAGTHVFAGYVEALASRVRRALHAGRRGRLAPLS